MNAIASFPTLHPSSTDIEFCTWLGQAAPGDRLEYYRGLLVVDAAEVVSLLPKIDRVHLNGLARIVHRAFELGLVHLVQVRLGPDRFAYLAIARPKKRGAAAVLPARLLEAA